ncbi:hypothetical protein BJ944DRAFT_271018 [Cunninghamella echinulata]|nr:hypothetical protein BJ944DRAFT_271018 [Cunninghamella echinulata]
MSFIQRFKPVLLKNSVQPTRFNTYRYYTTETTTEVKKGTFSFRSGFIGFLVGISLTGSIGYYYLLEEYYHASESLLTSVQELQASTEKVRDYAKKIEEVEKDLKYLKKNTASHQELEETKIQLRKLYDTLNMDHLELKTHVWGLEKDLNNVLK